MTRKLLAVWLCGALLTLATPACAADAYTLDVGLGPVLIAANENDPGKVDIHNGSTVYEAVDPAAARIVILGSATVSKATGASHIQLQNVTGALEVTLQGVTVADQADDDRGPLSVLYCDDVRLTLAGESRVALAGGSAAALDVEASVVTVRGDGSLEAMGFSPADAAGGTALSVTERSSLTLEGGALRLRGGDGGTNNAAFGGDALFCADSLLAITGGSLLAQGGNGGALYDPASEFTYLSGGCGVSMAMLSGEAGLTVSGGSLTALGGAGGALADGSAAEAGFAFVGAALTLSGAYAEAAARRVQVGATADTAAAWDETTPLDASTGEPWAYLFIGR